MKENSLYEVEELKDFFNKFDDMITLDSLGLLLEHTEYNYKNAELAFKIVSNKKWNDVWSDEMQGINEYDYLCILHNFNLDEVEEKIDLLNEKELCYFKDLIANGIDKIPIIKPRVR